MADQSNHVKCIEKFTPSNMEFWYVELLIAPSICREVIQLDIVPRDDNTVEKYQLRGGLKRGLRLVE